MIILTEKKEDIFLIFAQNIDGGSNDYIQSMNFSVKIRKTVYPCKVK